MTPDSSAAQRGLIFIQQGRYRDAEKYLREALSSDPNNPATLYYLALCELNQGRPGEARETIERALAMGPEVDGFHALRALCLLQMGKLDEAMASANEAVRLGPDSDFAFVAMASIHLAKKRWFEAETAARKALDLNPENSNASNILTTALRMQNRLEESADRVAYSLQQDPENPDNHVSAGWTALHQGKVKKAEEHFLEALRLEPGNDQAKDGLKEAFKSRSIIYRGYLQYCFFMQRLTTANQWLIIIGLLVGVRLARAYLPLAIATFVIGLYFLLVLWVHVARPVGNLQLMLDRFARHALSRGERWEACLAGGAVVIGAPLFFIGSIGGFLNPLIIGSALTSAAFPLAYIFTNRSRAGQAVFGLAAIGALVCGGLAYLSFSFGQPPSQQGPEYLLASAIIAMAVTWLCNIPALNRRW
ncbi:hypothetical protein DB345_16230 [Spartobacteria bacterium LR76]|nr:hypothetical protein DB345_16230 [Spartobacteria bacterium LR76]